MGKKYKKVNRAVKYEDFLNNWKNARAHKDKAWHTNMSTSWTRVKNDDNALLALNQTLVHEIEVIALNKSKDDYGIKKFFKAIHPAKKRKLNPNEENKNKSVVKKIKENNKNKKEISKEEENEEKIEKVKPVAIQIHPTPMQNHHRKVIAEATSTKINLEKELATTNHEGARKSLSVDIKKQKIIIENSTKKLKGLQRKAKNSKTTRNLFG
jgi:hypothetical protein